MSDPLLLQEDRHISLCVVHVSTTRGLLELVPFDAGSSLFDWCNSIKELLETDARSFVGSLSTQKSLPKKKICAGTVSSTFFPHFTTTFPYLHILYF